MRSITQNLKNFNHKGGPSPAILSTIDLIDHMATHHRDEALALVELAQWHEEQAKALAAERRALAADVTMVLREAEGLLR